MLRTLKNAFESPRLLGFKATSSGGSCTVNIGTDDAASAASSSTGRSYITLADVFSRTPVVVGSPDQATVGAAGAVRIEADPSISLLSLLTHDGTSADDGALYALALGWDSADTDIHLWGRQNAPHAVKNAWNSPRLEVFKITPHASSPAINIGAQRATLTRNGTGDYTVTFKRTFASSNVVAVGTVIKTTAAHLHVVSTSATAVRVLVGAAGVASDAAPFYLVVQGSDNPEYGARHRKATKVPERLPRIVAGHISYTAGAPSITVGTGDFTIADTGTGVLTATLVNAFAREPIVVSSQNAAGLVTLNAAATTSVIVLNAFDGAAAAADPADIHFMAFGFDDADEYSIG